MESLNENAAGTGNDTGESLERAETKAAVDNGQSNETAAVPPENAQQAGNMYYLPPGYMVDPATGQVVYVGQVYQQPPQQPSPEQIAAQQAAAQQRYGVVVNSVEKFIEGEATVSDVVKTLYANTSQDDQLWKGVIVGAAAAVLLTSTPVREAMGKTLGGLFPGLKERRGTVPGDNGTSADTSDKKETSEKE
ncbi:MAG: hypothetical protein CSA26_03295 [Desulfobacterales bacterium]|nr:MAG: hypothetical protein CSA26_03295 [Desulfobacterales bacterium]